VATRTPDKMLLLRSGTGPFNVEFRRPDGECELFRLPSVYSCVGSRTPEVQAQFAALRRGYEDAFQRFSQQACLLQSLLMKRPAPDKSAIEEAGRKVQQARSVYRESRDLLAQFMLSHDTRAANATGRRAQTNAADAGGEPQGGERNRDERSRVQQLAYRLWEEAGRPVGRAEEHWYRAEGLIHNSP